MNETTCDLTLENELCVMMDNVMNRLTALKQGNPHLNTETKRSAVLLDTMVRAMRAVVLDESLKII